MHPDDLFPTPAPGLDAVVRAALDADAARTDPAAVWNALQVRLAAESPVPDVPLPPRPNRPVERPAEPAGRVSRVAGRSRPPAGSDRRLVRWAVGAAAIAASVAVAFVFAPAPRVVSASPAEVVAAARDESAAGPDRCYRITADLPPTARDVFRAAAGEPRTVSTRGDRFVVEPWVGGKGAWGRDADGRVWVAPTPDGAVRYDEAELPAGLRNAVKIHGLELRSVLDDVLANFDLAWTTPPGTGDYAVTAARRTPPVAFRLLSADLLIDRESKAIRTLKVRRQLPSGEPAALTFDLTGSAARPDAAYTAEGHVAAGAPVYDKSRPVLRRRFVAQHLGELVAQPRND